MVGLFGLYFIIFIIGIVFNKKIFIFNIINIFIFNVKCKYNVKHLKAISIDR